MSEAGGEGSAGPGRLVSLDAYWGLVRLPQLFGGLYGPIYQSAAVLLGLWLICLWMDRQRIFIEI